MSSTHAPRIFARRVGLERKLTVGSGLKGVLVGQDSKVHVVGVRS